MIRNRNIASDAAIDPSKISGGLGIGIGETYYVYNSADSAIGEWLLDHNDNDHVISADSSTADVGLQKALDSCVACRNDYVVVMPSTTNYTFTAGAGLTMSKANVHFLCPAGIQHSIGSNYAARLQFSSSADGITVSARGCEIAGWDLRSGGTTYHSIVCSGAHGLHVHHNFFGMTGTVSQIHAASGNYKMLIEKNHFSTNTSSVTFTEAAAILLENNNNGWCRICDNVICIGDGCTAAQVIYHYGYKGECSRNVIFATETSGSGSAGTITTAIAMSGGSGIAADNRLGVANTADLSGMGTNMAQNNISGGSGGAISG